MQKLLGLLVFTLAITVAFGTVGCSKKPSSSSVKSTERTTVTPETTTAEKTTVTPEKTHAEKTTVTPEKTTAEKTTVTPGKTSVTTKEKTK